MLASAAAAQKRRVASKASISDIWIFMRIKPSRQWRDDHSLR
jgi:hypothetical protein